MRMSAMRRNNAICVLTFLLVAALACVDLEVAKVLGRSYAAVGSAIELMDAREAAEAGDAALAAELEEAAEGEVDWGIIGFLDPRIEVVRAHASVDGDTVSVEAEVTQAFPFGTPPAMSVEAKVSDRLPAAGR